MKTVPIIDPSDVDAGARIDAACRSVGFFAVPLDAPLRERRDELVALAAEFFALPEDEKAHVSMAVGGTASCHPIRGRCMGRTSGPPDPTGCARP